MDIIDLKYYLDNILKYHNVKSNYSIENLENKYIITINNHNNYGNDNKTLIDVVLDNVDSFTENIKSFLAQYNINQGVKIYVYKSKHKFEIHYKDYTKLLKVGTSKYGDESEKIYYNDKMRYNSNYEHSKSFKLNNIDYYGKRVKLLGQGGFGEVYEYKNSTESVAIKLSKSIDYYVDHFPKESFILEQSILAELDHPNIISILDILKINTDNTDTIKFGIVLQLAYYTLPTMIYSQQNLLNDNMKTKIFYNMLLSVAYIHSKNIIHTDIKPNNFLIIKDDKYFRLVLSDFGISHVQVCKNIISYNQGTFIYNSPEFLDKFRIDKKSIINKSTDIWSLACCVYEMYTKTVLFDDNTSDDYSDIIINKIKSENLLELITDPNVKHILELMLVINSNLRISAYDALRNSYFDTIRLETMSEGQINIEYQIPPCATVVQTRERYPFNFISTQKNINIKMLYRLYEWLSIVCTKCKLNLRILLLTIQLIDELISLRQILMTEIQLYGISCLYLAFSMYDSNYNFDFYTDLFWDYDLFQINDVNDKCVEILEMLNYDINTSVASDYYNSSSDNDLSPLINGLILLCYMSELRFKLMPNQIFKFCRMLSKLYKGVDLSYTQNLTYLKILINEYKNDDFKNYNNILSESFKYYTDHIYDLNKVLTVLESKLIKFETDVV